MVVSAGKNLGVLVFSVFVCLGSSVDYHQELIRAGKAEGINHHCPSWFVPVSNGSACKCGKPIHHPVSVIQCDPNTHQTLMLPGNCMDLYNDSVVVIGRCLYSISQRDNVSHGVYVNPPQNVSELNHCLCSRFNRTGLMCSQCYDGLGTAIFSYSMQCLTCMSSGLGWMLYVFLATFPTTILFLVLLMFQVRITLGPLNAYIFVCQLLASTTYSSQNSLEDTSPFISAIWTVILTIYGIWNLDFLRYFLPSFCASEQLGTIHVVTLEYLVAFYPLLLTVIAYICIQLHARDCQVMVCLWQVFCKCFSCCRQRWGRQWDPAASLVHTFAAFLLLSYSKILTVSLQLLTYTQLYKPTGKTIDPPRRVYLNPSFEWFGVEHLPFAIPAIFVIFIFIFMPALFLFLYPMRIFQKCLGCCGRRLLVLHAFADVFQGCYKNGTNGTRDCRYFAGLYLVLRIVMLITLYGGFVGFYEPMISIVSLVITALLFLLFRPYKNDSWLNVWDSIALSLFAFALFCIMYSQYIAYFPTEIAGLTAIVPLAYSIIYGTYKLLVCTKVLKLCKQKLIPESQDPDRLMRPKEYGPDEAVMLLSPEIDINQKDEYSQDRETGTYPGTETYPACGNSQ